jgi:RluA family pseudouridine synthase
MDCISGSTASVKVPAEGWYSFSFGRKDNISVEKTSVDDTRGSENEGVAKLQIFSPSESSSSPRIKAYNLPLIYNGIPLCTTDIGMLFFLAEGATLSITTPQRSTRPESWSKLQFIRAAPRQTIEDSSSIHLPSSGSFATANEEDSFHRQSGRKPLVCTLCCRVFPTVSAVQNHALQVHSSADLYSDPIWRTPLEVVYQDHYLAVVVKPQGMAVQGCKVSLLRSNLLDALAAKSTAKEGDERPLAKPRPVHRLDAGTGGLLVVAKTRLAESKLKESFRDRTCQKRYRALVWGKLEVEASSDMQGMNSPIGRCDLAVSGKPALSLYQVSRHVQRRDVNTPHSPRDWLTVVDVWPETGRRHQLRKHLQALGHPIVGDARYGGTVDASGAGDAATGTQATNTDPFSRLCLWAVAIAFPHPVVRDKIVTCETADPAWLDFVLQHVEAGDTCLQYCKAHGGQGYRAIFHSSSTGLDFKTE